MCYPKFQSPRGIQILDDDRSVLALWVQTKFHLEFDVELAKVNYCDGTSRPILLVGCHVVRESYFPNCIWIIEFLIA